MQSPLRQRWQRTATSGPRHTVPEVMLLRREGRRLASSDPHSQDTFQALWGCARVCVYVCFESGIFICIFQMWKLSCFSIYPWFLHCKRGPWFHSVLSRMSLRWLKEDDTQVSSHFAEGLPCTGHSRRYLTASPQRLCSFPFCRGENTDA